MSRLNALLSETVLLCRQMSVLQLHTCRSARTSLLSFEIIWTILVGVYNNRIILSKILLYMGYSKVEVATYSVLQGPASAEGLVVSKNSSYVFLFFLQILFLQQLQNKDSDVNKYNVSF